MVNVTQQLPCFFLPTHSVHYHRYSTDWYYTEAFSPYGSADLCSVLPKYQLNIWTDHRHITLAKVDSGSERHIKWNVSQTHRVRSPSSPRRAFGKVRPHNKHVEGAWMNPHNRYGSIRCLYFPSSSQLVTAQYFLLVRGHTWWAWGAAVFCPTLAEASCE